MVRINAGEPGVVPPSAFRLAPIVAVAPLLLGFLASLSIVLGPLVGWSPFLADPVMTVSEAAGVGNAGEVVRLIVVEGQDPNRAWRVRAGIVHDSELVITPLEAAIRIRREQLVPVLLRHGASVPASGPARTALICRAVEFQADRIAEILLKMGDGSDPRGSCPPPAN